MNPVPRAGQDYFPLNAHLLSHVLAPVSCGSASLSEPSPTSLPALHYAQTFLHKHLTGQDADCECGCKVDSIVIQTTTTDPNTVYLPNQSNAIPSECLGVFCFCFFNSSLVYYIPNCSYSSLPFPTASPSHPTFPLSQIPFSPSFYQKTIDLRGTSTKHSYNKVRHIPLPLQVLPVIENGWFRHCVPHY